jgi:predicted DNA-binding transcriptional regulator AlpA
MATAQIRTLANFGSGSFSREDRLVKNVALIAAKEATAAKLMDMSLAEFRKLVTCGALPSGREIAPGFVRWSVDELRTVLNGDAANRDRYEW